MRNNHTQHTKFSISINENQQKNLFDLCVGIVVLIVVILTLSQNVQPKPVLPCKTSQNPLQVIALHNRNDLLQKFAS